MLCRTHMILDFWYCSPTQLHVLLLNQGGPVPHCAPGPVFHVAGHHQRAPQFCASWTNKWRNVAVLTHAPQGESSSFRMISRPQLILDFWYCSPTLRRHRLPLNDTAKEAVDLHHRKRIKVAVSTQFACNALALCLVGGLDQR